MKTSDFSRIREIVLCYGKSELFFYEKDSEDSQKTKRLIENAKAICAECPSLIQCRKRVFSLPLSSHDNDVIAGMSARERRKVIGARKRLQRLRTQKTLQRTA